MAQVDQCGTRLHTPEKKAGNWAGPTPIQSKRIHRSKLTFQQANLEHSKLTWKDIWEMEGSRLRASYDVHSTIISVVRAGECLVTLSARVCTTLLDPGRAGRPWSQTAPSNRDNNSLSLARPHLEARRRYASWNTPGMSGVVGGDVVGIKWNTLKTNSAYLMFPIK